MAKTEKNNSGKKLKNDDKLARILSLPEGTFKNYPLIELRGNREITIDGCTGLISYENEYIVLETKVCRIHVSGKNLMLRNLSRSMLSVLGYIKNVEFKM